MQIPFSRRRRILAFTLVELLVVIAIIALLAGVTTPSFQLAIRKAQSVKCSQHLHSIGIAVMSYATDHNELIPEIDQAATNVYQPVGSVQGIVGVLGSYGITTNDIQCPLDMAMGTAGSFAQYHSSYEWNPVFDDGTEPVTQITLGPIQVAVNPNRVRLCTDFVAIHNNKVNALYADGHIRAR